MSKIVIGRKDIADFPEFGIKDIAIKVDTGAYTSAIHCHHIEERVVEGKKMIKFELLDPSHPQYEKREYRTGNYKQKSIKNSFGRAEKRYVISTLITLFEKDYPIELSLSERGEMKYPVLIGRKLLKGRFIVDSAQADLSKHMKKIVFKRS